MNKGRGIEWRLSYRDLCTLLEEAGITSADMSGHRADGYVLGRYGDTGPYEIGNCRFITVRENLAEMDYAARGIAISAGKKGKNSHLKNRQRDTLGRLI